MAEPAPAPPTSMQQQPASLPKEGMVFVQKPGVRIRSEPNRRGRVIGSATKGDQFKVVGRSGSWVQVEGDAGSGWIGSRMLGSGVTLRLQSRDATIHRMVPFRDQPGVSFPARRRAFSRRTDSGTLRGKKQWRTFWISEGLRNLNINGLDLVLLLSTLTLEIAAELPGDAEDTVAAIANRLDNFAKGITDPRMNLIITQLARYLIAVERTA